MRGRGAPRRAGGPALSDPRLSGPSRRAAAERRGRARPAACRARRWLAGGRGGGGTGRGPVVVRGPAVLPRRRRAPGGFRRGVAEAGSGSSACVCRAGKAAVVPLSRGGRPGARLPREASGRARPQPRQSLASVGLGGLGSRERLPVVFAKGCKAPVWPSPSCSFRLCFKLGE